MLRTVNCPVFTTESPYIVDATPTSERPKGARRGGSPLGQGMKAMVNKLYKGGEGMKQIPVERREYTLGEISTSTFLGALSKIKGIQVSKLKSLSQEAPALKGRGSSLD